MTGWTTKHVTFVLFWVRSEHNWLLEVLFVSSFRTLAGHPKTKLS